MKKPFGLRNKKQGMEMISYAPFYRTLSEKNITTYKLINQYNVSRSLIDRLKHNKPLSTVTLNDLCIILNCRIDDIVEYVPDKDEINEKLYAVNVR